MATINFTKHGLTFTLRWKPEEGIPALHSAIADCCIAAEAMRDEIPENLLPDTPDAASTPPPQQASPPPKREASTGSVEFHTIRHEFQDKHRFKLLGGAYTQYGIAIYPEVRGDERLRQKVFDAPLGDTPCEIIGTIVYRNGKPYKVVEIC